jgi:hypothetical protein
VATTPSAPSQTALARMTILVFIEIPAQSAFWD